MELQGYCPRCGQGFADSHEAIAHIRRLHPDSDLSETLFHIALTLDRIASLLQQLVDKGQQVTPPQGNTALYRCTTCGLSWDTYELANSHWTSGEHGRMLAKAATTR